LKDRLGQEARRQFAQVFLSKYREYLTINNFRKSISKYFRISFFTKGRKMAEIDQEAECWNGRDSYEDIEVSLGELIQSQSEEIRRMPPNELKNHQLPLARVKKIMKTDEDVKMISSETPVLFAKACEMFILEITRRAWVYTEDNKRRTLQKSDIADAIMHTAIYDFLEDVVHPMQ
jgi:histone H3/H4